MSAAYATETRERSRPSFHLENPWPLSMATATRSDWTVPKRHWIRATSNLFGKSDGPGEFTEEELIDLEDEKEGPGYAGGERQKSPQDPQALGHDTLCCCSLLAAVIGEDMVVVQGPQQRPSIQGDDQHSGEAERDAGSLGHSRRALELHRLHPAVTSDATTCHDQCHHHLAAADVRSVTSAATPGRR
ncbi:unnamed protein product [Urochloa humidicola]